MYSIFHERQEGSLCAQHCLNSLLQSDYYSADVLSDLAKELDQSERLLDPNNDKPSNCDDSGFFSIQVLQNALTVWNIELRPITSADPECRAARDNPCSQKAFICNFREHWFTVRRLGNQWFNLNSLLSGPELLSDTYLSLFLTQLQREGYSIFVVIGELPSCEADSLLRLMPAVQDVKPTLITDDAAGSSRSGGGGANSSSWDGDYDDELQHALNESRQLHESDDLSLKHALQLSMSEAGSAHYSQSGIDPPSVTPDQDELRRLRLARYENASATAAATSGSQPTAASPAIGGQQPRTAEELTDEQMLAEAIKLSMQNDT